MNDSMPMVLFIIVYMLYFSWMGQRLFSGTLEGVQYFDTFGDSFFNMLVLMTTSNFPDVMLPAYQISRLNALFFIIYLLLGLFLMMNLLLAIFYSNFKLRFEQNLEKSDEDRSDYLFKQFMRFGGDKGFLTQKESYKMFMMIHGLATGTNQEIEDEEVELGRNSSMNGSGFNQNMKQSTRTSRKRDISIRQFDYIYKNKIEQQLEEKGKFKFTDLNLLLNGYEYWRYENINKQTFKQLDQDGVSDSQAQSINNSVA